MTTAPRLWCTLLAASLLGACFSTDEPPDWLPQYIETEPDVVADTTPATPDVVADTTPASPDADSDSGDPQDTAADTPEPQDIATDSASDATLPCVAEACDDSDPCTTDACIDNVCVNTPVAGCCSETTLCPAADDVCAPNLCVDSACVPTATDGCCSETTLCPEGDDVCVGVTCTDNACVSTSVDDCCLNDAACDDNNACTTDACTDNTCAEPVLLADGTACGSGLACTDGVCTEPPNWINMIQMVSGGTCNNPTGDITMGAYTSIQGVVTAGPLALDDEVTRVVVSDSTDGPNSAITVHVAAADGSPVATGWYLGAQVTFDGTHQETQCHTEVHVSSEQVAASAVTAGPNQSPVELTAAELVADLEGWESVLVRLISLDDDYVARGTELDGGVLHTDLCADCDPPIGVDGWLLPEISLDVLPIAELTGVVHQVGDQFLISPRYSNEITLVPLCGEGSCDEDCACPNGQVCGDEGCDWPACTCFGSGCENTCADGLRCVYMLEQPWKDYDAVCGLQADTGFACVVWSYEDGGNGHAYEVHGVFAMDVTCESDGECDGGYCGEGGCYSDDTTYWSEAASKAAQVGGTLISLTSSEEIAYLEDYLKPALVTHGWDGWIGHGPFLGASQDQLPTDGAMTDGWSWMTSETWDDALAEDNWAFNEPGADGGDEDGLHCLAFKDLSFKAWNAWPCSVSSAWTVERPSAMDNKPALEAASSLACMPSTSELPEGAISDTSKHCAEPLQCLHGKCQAVCQTNGDCGACPNGFDPVDLSVKLGLCKD
jgi:hypothetical protein